MQKTIYQAFDGQVKVIEENLSDGSKVFNLWIGSHEIPAVDETAATDAYVKILDAERTAKGES